MLYSALGHPSQTHLESNYAFVSCDGGWHDEYAPHFCKWDGVTRVGGLFHSADLMSRTQPE